MNIILESIRQGLPHITSMDHNQFHDLIKTGNVHLHDVTEKTDGSTFMMGHDAHGFYTQSSGSGSERMRKPSDYHDRVTRRAKETGKEPDYTGANAFSDAHESLQKNEKLLNHLKTHAEKHSGETQVRGELFSRKLARSSEEHPNEVKLVGTSYDPSRWGSKGQIVIHTKLPENALHDSNHFKKNLSSSEINFEDDKIDHKPSSVNVRDEVTDFKGINRGLLASRTTKTNKIAKQAEQDKLRSIQQRVSDKVDSHVKSLGIIPKFGSGSEGAVVHPKPGSNAPRFKVTSDTFRSYKADPEAKMKFKQRLKEWIVLNEGGNIKVKTPSGEVSAAPFKVENRTTQAGDARDALSSIHNSFHSEHSEHLFGKNQKGLKTGSIFGGSTKHFMDTKIPDKEFKLHKSSVGDFDVQITQEHKDKISSTLTPGKRFGKYTVVGMKKHGNENTAVMRHDNGEHHQFDFEGVDYHNDEPTKASQFLHSADWNDTKAGIKGAHHKVLINAVGGDTHKFSITHGLRSRTDESDKGIKEPEGISNKLFGNKADHSQIHSFIGVSSLIKKHIPKERHQEIYDKFKSSLKSISANHDGALNHLRSTLGVKDSVNEENEEVHHTSVIPMTGFSPISHMGHAQDLGGELRKLPGTKHVGISGKADLFSPDERKNILSRQWGEGSQEVHVVSGAGETIRKAHDSLPEGKKVLHLLVGHDRKNMAEGLKKSLESGKIKEMEGKQFHSIQIHYPEDKDRSHGMSGTKMRQAASDGNLEEFHRHLGPNFTSKEAKGIMGRVHAGLKSGKIKLVREHLDIGELNHEKFGPMLDSFTQFASKKLSIKDMPEMKLSKEDLGKSFGGYSPSSKSIMIVTKNRHPMDIFRTVAHELVHHKQNEDGNLGKDIAKEGATGSKHENEANAEAGKIMRWFGKNNPEMFKSGFVVESYLDEGLQDPTRKKAVFLAGGPGSGKDFILSRTLQGHGLKEINSDTAFEAIMKRRGLSLKMPESERVQKDIARGVAKTSTKKKQDLSVGGGQGLIINSTADDPAKIAMIKKHLEDNGYDTSMVFVHTANEVSRARNQGRERNVPEDIRQEKWDAAQKAKGPLQDLFGKDKFHHVDNTEDYRRVSPERKKEIDQEHLGIFKKIRAFTTAPIESKESIAKEMQKRGITKFSSARATRTSQRQSKPAPYQPNASEIEQAKRLGIQHKGSGQFGGTDVTHVSRNGQLTAISEDLRTWFKQKWVRFDTKGNIKGDCAREPGEGKPKCRPLASAVAMGKEARAKAARRKRREDPVADRSGKGNKPVNVKTESVQKAIDIINRDRMSEDTLMEKNIPTNPQLWSRAKSLAKSKFDVYPSAYANGWASKWYKSKGGGWKTAANESIEEACWDTHKQVGMKKKGNRMVPDCVPKNEAFEAFMKENTSSDREWGTDSLTKIYKENTPGQTIPINPLSEKKKIKKLEKEDVSPALGYEFGNNGIGPTFGVVRSPNGLGTGYSMPMTSMAESVQKWASNTSTIERFKKRYGDLAEQKIYQTALKLNEMNIQPKSISKIREAWEAKSGSDMGTVPNQNKEELNERGADSKGLYRSTESGAGLTAKGAKHFGVKTAVTTPPSKLKPGSKAAKRRKSFCARMGGMKGPMKDEKGRPTRKAMSLRRWNCEE